jgi:hypothetical protein
MVPLTLRQGIDGLHGLISMRLPVPPVEDSEEIHQRFEFEILKACERSPLGIESVCFRRFVPGMNGGALPRTPPSFTLRMPRFAGRQIGCAGRKGERGDWWASHWLSASCRWRCRPSQPRIGLGNRFPGFWSDRTPLAHRHTVRSSECINKHMSFVGIGDKIPRGVLSEGCCLACGRSR